MRLTIHRDDNAILLYYDEDNQYVKKLADKGYFDKIVYFDSKYSIMFKDDIENRLTDYYDVLLESNNIDLEKIKQIYTSCDNYDNLAVYLHMKKKQFTVFEIMPHQFQIQTRATSVIEGSNTHDQTISKAFYDIQKEVGNINGYGQYVKPLLFDESGQMGINFYDLVKEVPENARRNLSEIFDIGYYFNGAQLILLNSWYSTVDWSRFSKDHYLYLYQLLVDYDCNFDKKITVKPHPHSDPNVGDYFPGCIIADNKMPIQMVIFKDDVEIDSSFGGFTSSIEFIREKCKKNNAMGWGLFKLGHYYHHIGIIRKIISDNNIETAILHHLTESITDDGAFIEKQFESKDISYYDYGQVITNQLIIGENILLSELSGEAYYFLLDYDNTGWAKYLLESNIGQYEYTISVSPGTDNYIGVPFVNKMILLTNNNLKGGKYHYKLPVSNSIVDVSCKILKERTSEKTIKCELPVTENPVINYRIGSMLRKNKANLSIGYFKKSASKHPWACYEWFDMLYEEGIPIDDDYLVETIISYADKGDPEGQKRAGSLFRHGWGVEKDVEKAAGYYRPCSRSIPWACYEWFDMLYEEGIPIDDDLLTIMEDYSEDGSEEATFRIKQYNSHWRRFISRCRRLLGYLKK